jgi:hypothetical protein
VNVSNVEKGASVGVLPYAEFENGYVYELDDLEEDTVVGEPLEGAAVMEDPRIAIAQARLDAHATSPVEDNGGPTLSELREQAKDLNIEGRSSMNKAELTDAIAAVNTEETDNAS